MTTAARVIAGDSRHGRGRRSIAWAIGAALMIAANYLLFDMAGRSDALWGRQLLDWRIALYGLGIAAIHAVVAPFIDVGEAFGTGRRDARPTLLAICAAAVGVGIVLGTAALQSFPNSGDEYAYLFQALTYRAGRLWNDAPILGRDMASTYTWVVGDKWAGGYAPGWPMLMVASMAVGLPGWTINLALLPAGVVMLYDLVRRRADPQAGTLAAALFALSPFTSYNAASYFPHLSAAVLVILAFWLADRLARARAVPAPAEGASSRGWALLLGAALGLLGITRSVDAVIVAPPLLFMVGRTRWFWTRGAWLIALGGLPFLAVLLWYQRALTGSVFTPTYYMGGRTVDHLYFDWSHVKVGAMLTIRRLCELSLWTSLPLVGLWLTLLAYKARRRRIEPVDALLPFAMAILLFYPFEGGNRYGPRYYLDFWMALVFTTTTALPLLAQRYRRAATTIIGLTVMQGLIVAAFLARDYRMIVIERRDVYAHSDDLATQRSVICIASSTGAHLELEPADLTRNGIGRPAGPIYARCDATTVRTIRDKLPGYRILFYKRALGSARGRLIPMPAS